MAAVESPVAPAVTEPKAARKKKGKGEAATVANGSANAATAVPDTTSKDNSTMAEADSTAEHPYIKELQKQIRNITKKLTTHKLDAILAANPGVPLDTLVAERKINADQRAAAEKKPQLLAQLADLEERQDHYRKFDSEHQAKLSKQREELTAQHQQEVDKLKENLRVEAISVSSSDLRKKLLVFSQFLRAAAAKRGVDEDPSSEESQAFEGALLLVYGGDSKAVDAAVNLIEGTDQPVPSVDGIPTSVTFKRVKEAALAHAPFQAEEDWVDKVAEATAADADASIPTSDPTITHAGLTEIDGLAQTNGAGSVLESTSAAPVSAGEAGNVAGERWDTNAAGAGAERGDIEDNYEIVPRPNDEVDHPAEEPLGSSAAVQSQTGTNWADDATHEATVGVGNQASEKWDLKPAGETDNSWGASEPAATPTTVVANDDGFSQVPGRHRGRGGPRGRGGDGEGRGGRGRGRGRGRGDGEFRGGRGDGEFRGGRGGRGGFRGDGEFRGGRGGRGRGAPRGAGGANAASTTES